MGVIFDIQFGAMYDGPGIRSCVFFKGCPLSCAWCHNPESQIDASQVGWVKDKCAACGACVKACPNKALVLSETGITRNAQKCRACGICVAVCPNDAHEKIGFEISAEELVARLLPDRPFYEASGGGVTISGGEPTRQPEFLIDVLSRLKKESIHTAIETCGYFKSAILNVLLDKVDLFLFDFKHIDTAMHRRYIGMDNKIIIENLHLLIQHACDRTVVRIPVIPGFNDAPETLQAMAEYLRSMGFSGRVDLMPYHGWAKGKYERIGRLYDYHHFGQINEEEKRRILDLFQIEKLQPVWGG